MNFPILIYKQNLTLCKIPKILPNFLVWEFCRNAQLQQNFWAIPRKLRQNCASPQNAYARKLGDIAEFYAF